VLAAISDRGRQRSRNQDSYAVEAVDGRLVAVVCDGVASTDNAGWAAEVAARTALGCLLAGLAAGSDWTALAQDAVAAAQAAVQDATDGAVTTDASTTLTLALVQTGEVVVANVGDSRAYWIGDDGRNLLLSIDDSWENFATSAGLPEPVARDPSRLHEITAWLGPDADLVAPHVIRHCPDGGGVVVLCSDGLWNYAAPPDALGALVSESADWRPGHLARHLAQAAIEAGGADNVTVAVLSHPASPGETELDKEKRDDDHV
jgi:serine/threonine protein phosphatase PrpC